MQVIPSEIQWAQALVTLVVGGLITVVGTSWAFAKWRGRPKFVVGVPPSFAEQTKDMPEVGKKSIVNEFNHDSACLAKRFRGDKEALSDSEIKRLYAPPCGREIKLDPDNSATLAVIVENHGRRAARDYIMGISIISPHIHIVDVATESLKPTAFYCNREDLVESARLQSCLTDKRIVQAYDNYMDVGEQYGDMIFLKGDLESGVYEMVLLKSKVSEQGVDKFIVRYHLDCSDGWISKQNYLQGFVISKATI